MADTVESLRALVDVLLGALLAQGTPAGLPGWRRTT